MTPGSPIAGWVGVALALLGGCAATHQGAATSPQSSGMPPETPEAAALAERAKRDVEQIKQLGPKAGVDPGTQAAAPAVPDIQWIVPPRDRGGLPSAEAAAQHPLANAAPPAPKPPEELPGGQVVTPAPDRERMLQLTVDLCSELYRQGAYSNVPLRELLLIAATSLVTPDRALVPDALPGLSERERELLARMQEFFAEIGRGLQEDRDPEAIVKAIEQLHQILGRQPRLTLPKAALCTRVGGFGDYDEFARNEAGRYSFLAHSGQQAVVYVEVADFTSALNEQGQWVTELSQQLVLYSDRDGIPVWRESWQPGHDTSRNRRGDFFVVQIITLPAQLSVGRYQLKVQVRDDKSRAEAEIAVDLEMLADPRMTK
jgi:hypothetical protein